MNMILGTLLIVALAAYASAYRLVCYYNGDAINRTGEGKCEPEHLDGSLCTHIVYAYKNAFKYDLFALETSEIDTMNRLLRFKKIYPSLKIMLAMAGNFVEQTKEYPYLKIMRTAASRSEFALNVYKYLIKYGFDGVEVNQYYPNTRSRPVLTKAEIIAMFETLYNTFEAQSEIFGTDRLLLSAALPTAKYLIDDAFDVKAISEHVDFISITTFDYHGSWESSIGFNAPLFSNPKEFGIRLQDNVDWTIKYYLLYLVPKEKINLGIPTYGRTFTMVDREKSALGGSSKGPGKPGPFTNTSGFLSFFEICNLFNFGASIYKIPTQKSSYAIMDDLWISYDDFDSVVQKACYTKRTELGGITVRSLDYDDFFGIVCHSGKFPLISAIYSLLSDYDPNGCIQVDVMYLKSTSASLLKEQKPGVYLIFIVWSVVLIGYYQRQ